MYKQPYIISCLLLKTLLLLNNDNCVLSNYLV